MSSFVESLLRVITFGLYGRGKSSKNVKRYTKDGVLRVEKNVERQGVGAFSNDAEILTGSEIVKHNQDD